jgi:carbonic anhydrase
MFKISLKPSWRNAMLPILALLAALATRDATATPPPVELTEQSPIDIRADNTTFAALPGLNFSYGSSVTLDVENTGSPDPEKSIRANVSGGAGKVTVSGVDYDLLQFHFHTEAEHLINGHRAEMELHFVHKATDGTLLVVGEFIELGAANTTLAPIFSNLPATSGSSHLPITNFDLNALLPTNLESFRYGGSLTTEPYTEGVKWNVLNTALTMSEEQIDAFRHLFNGPEGNSRAVQALNGRPILTDVPGFAVAVPEPETYALLMVGLLGVGVAARRRVAA